MSFRTPVSIARYLRQNQTPAERHAWELLRGRRMLGLKFRRQHRIGPFIVDFYCASLRLVLELEGPVHRGRAAADEERRAWLEARGFTVVRIRNDLVSEEVLCQILREATTDPSPHTSGNPDE